MRRDSYVMDVDRGEIVIAIEDLAIWHEIVEDRKL